MASTPTQAETPQDLADLVGARGSSGETQMQARGYSFVRSAPVRDQSWSYWWSDVQRQCVSISTMDGRYASIQQVPAQNCSTGRTVDVEAGMVALARPERHPDSLTLICYGEGSRLQTAPRVGYQWDEHRRRYEPTNGVETVNEQFASAIQVDIRDGQGRIHLNKKLLPLIHSGGDQDWWALDDLRVTSSRVVGSYRLNALSHHKVEIDRNTGVIEVSGKPGFSGRCDMGSWGSPRF